MPVDGARAPRVRERLVELPGNRPGAPPPRRLDGVPEPVVLQPLARAPHRVDVVDAATEALLYEWRVVPPRAEVLVHRVRPVGRPAVLGRDQAVERVRHPLDAELAVQPRRAGVVVLVVASQPLVLPGAVDVCVWPTERRGRQPRAARIELVHDLAQR